MDTACSPVVAIKPKMEHQVSQAVSSSSEIELRVRVEAIPYTNSEDGWTVVQAIDLDMEQSVKIVGYFALLEVGDYYRFYGSWEFKASHGKQFTAKRWLSSRPTTNDGIKRYLCSGLFKGIGKKTAEKIVGHFGKETLNILDHNPERLSEVKRINKNAVEQLICRWKKKLDTDETIMFLYQYGITGKLARRIFKYYGSSAAKNISENPYRLIKIMHGVGFNTADKVARSVGIEPLDSQRLQAGIVHVLNLAENDCGHCYLTTSQLVSKLHDILRLKSAKVGDVASVELPGRGDEKGGQPNPPELTTTIAAQILALEETGRLVTIESSCGRESYHYSAELYRCEIDIKSSLDSMMSTPLPDDIASCPSYRERIYSWIRRYCATTKTNLTEKQRTAVYKAATHKVFVLTGGPGVGKTTTVTTIVRLFLAIKKDVKLAAPTGRAAQRMSEVSGLKALTIHRLLKWSAKSQQDEGTFAHDENNLLKTEVLIVDECSMLDVRLAASLFKALSPKAQLILIGDSDQLPSVGPGNVLADLLKSSAVPYVLLDTVFRQAKESDIIRIAHQINKGSSLKFSNTAGSDCWFIPVLEAGAIKEKIGELIVDLLPAAGYDNFRDIQLLSPMNKGVLGCVALNELIQSWLNPLGKAIFTVDRRSRKPICIGDKVIQVVNNYELRVFNGDIGYVRQANAKKAEVFVEFPQRELVKYNFEQAQGLYPAYAITVHKSQGSEFPVVIIPMSMSYYIMLQRNLVYTALTRAKSLAIFVGEYKALTRAIRNTQSGVRQTNLCSLLSGNTLRVKSQPHEV